MMYLLSLFILANTLIFAALMKMLDRARFANQVLALFRMPRLIAWIVPIVEISCGIGLLFDLPLFHFLCLVLMTTFLLIILWMYTRAKSSACHCFGMFSDGHVGWQEVVRNFVLFGLSVSLIANLPHHSVALAETLVLYVASIGIIVISVLIPQLDYCRMIVRKISV